MKTQNENPKKPTDSKDKVAPQWYPGDAGGAEKKPGREQKANKASFENPKEED